MYNKNSIIFFFIEIQEYVKQKLNFIFLMCGIGIYLFLDLLKRAQKVIKKRLQQYNYFIKLK